MKFTGITIPSVSSSLLSTNGSGLIGAASVTDIVNVLPVSAQNPGGRLTLTSGAPVTVSDVSGSTLYYTPSFGDTIPLWNNGLGIWELLTFTEQSISLSGLTASKVYDIFAVNNLDKTFTLAATAWTNFTTRATGLAFQNGVLVKSGSPTSRYLGSVALNGSSVAQDTLLQRWVWNASNRVARKAYSADTNSGSYTLVGGAGVWQYCRNTAATSQFSVLIGRAYEPIIVTAENYASVPAAASMAPGINASTFGSPAITNNCDSGYSIGNSTVAIQTGADMRLMYQPTVLGLYLFTQLEFAIAGTVTFFSGASASGNFRMGMSGLFWG